MAASSLLAALLVSGCTSSAPIGNLPRIPADIQARTSDGPNASPNTTPVIRPDDKISISVAREPTLSLDSVLVAEDGAFDLPYVGRIAAAGRTTQEVAEEVRKRLADSYLTDPHVAVNIVEYASHIVTVEGAVARPGMFNFNKGTTLLGALATAQGPLRTAKLDQIAVFRMIAGERNVAVFNLKDVRSGKSPDLLLEPGDRIVVGSSAIKQGWLDFLQTAPLVGMFRRF